MDFSTAAETFIKLTVGDGLVTQIPALIVSLAAGLVVSKGGNKGTADLAIVAQLGGYPKALMMAAGMLMALSLIPGLPFLPFAMLGGIMMGSVYALRRVRADEERKAEAARKSQAEEGKKQTEKESAKSLLRTPEIELCLGKQIMGMMMANQAELGHRVAKMRRKFASSLWLRRSRDQAHRRRAAGAQVLLHQDPRHRGGKLRIAPP